MPDALSTAIDRYLADLRLQNASPHTLRNYASDLEQFAAYFTPPGQHPPSPPEFTVLQIREWLGDLYHRRLSPVSVRRKLAAVRSLFQFLAKQGSVPSNIARLVKTPKAPQRLPAVPTTTSSTQWPRIVWSARSPNAIA
jgi:integrase/recombinase XerC